MIISKATKADYPKVKELLDQFGKMVAVDENYFNDQDIALKVTDFGRVIGFFWAGVMANGTFAYADRAIIHPDYRNSGVFEQLCTAMVDVARDRGVKLAFTIIYKDSGFYKPSLNNALKAGFKQVPGDFSTLILNLSGE